MSVETIRELSIGEQVAIANREASAASSEERASKIDIAIHAMQVILEATGSDELIAAIGPEVTESDLHESRALLAELAEGEHRIGQLAMHGVEQIQTFGLPS